MANAHLPSTEINAIVLSADYAIKPEEVRRLRNAKNVLRKDGRKTPSGATAVRLKTIGYRPNQNGDNAII